MKQITKYLRYLWYLTAPFMFLYRKVTTGKIDIYEWSEQENKLVVTGQDYPDGALLWTCVKQDIEEKL